MELFYKPRRIMSSSCEKTIMNNEHGISYNKLIQPFLHLPAGKGRFITSYSKYDILIPPLNLKKSL